MDGALQKLVLVCLVVTFASVIDADYFTCTVPQWQGSMQSSMGFIDNPQAGDIQTFSKYFYDATNKRQLTITNRVQNGIESASRELVRYDSKTNKTTIYQIDTKAGTCNKISVLFFLRMCLPINARFAGDHVIGTNLQVTDYQIPKTTSTVTYTVQKLNDGYIPVSTSVDQFSKDRFSPSRFVLNELYFDIKTEIKDPSIFDIPAVCKPSDQVNE